MVLRVSDTSRSSVEISIDGSERGELKPKQQIQIRGSGWGWEVPCVARPESVLLSKHERTGSPAADGWIEDINDLLGFNHGFGRSYSMKLREQKSPSSEFDDVQSHNFIG